MLAFLCDGVNNATGGLFITTVLFTHCLLQPHLALSSPDASGFHAARENSNDTIP
jgi:hypothetical protein